MPKQSQINEYSDISKPPMCATIWIKNRIAFDASSKGYKFQDKAWRLIDVGIKKEPQISRLIILRII